MGLITERQLRSLPQTQIHDRPYSPELEEATLVTNLARYSIHSSSMDSGVALGSEPPLSPSKEDYQGQDRSFFEDDESDQETGDFDQRYAHGHPPLWVQLDCLSLVVY
jgi:hypothetical protein